jgi:hypothetical protein
VEDNKEMVEFQKIQEVLTTGNLAILTPKQRVEYLNKLCELTGLNPLTKPFEIIKFQGREIVYATRGCADQLRRIHKVSIVIKDKSVMDGLLTVTVEGTDMHGRTDTDIGVVVLPDKAGPADKANLFMKAVTKAKRRLTLSMCGLGLLDESELDTMDTTPEPNNISMNAPAIESKDTTVSSNSYNGYVIKDGKYAGRLISSVDPEELLKYINTISEMLTSKGQPFPTWFAELQDEVMN